MVLATLIVLITLFGRPTSSHPPPMLLASVVSLLVNPPFRGVMAAGHAKIQPRLGVVSNMSSPRPGVSPPVKNLSGRLH
eukprot:scaffold11724_cov124-Isochrysis_galbana.AAC.2